MTLALSGPADLRPVPQAAPAHCTDCPIRHAAICGILPPEPLAALERMRITRHLDADEQVGSQADSGRYVAVVRSGILKLTASVARGDQLIVGLALPGGLVGRATGKGTGFDVQPVDTAQVCLFPRQAFEALARDYPPLGHALLQGALNDLDDARRWMRLLAAPQAMVRVATLLIHLADLIGEPTPVAGQCYLAMPMSRQQIADLLGLSIETVSRQLTVLRAEGVVASPNRNDLLVRDLGALRARSAAQT